MSHNTSKQTGGASPRPAPTLDELGVPLEELVHRGARQLIQRAIEVEVEALLCQWPPELIHFWPHKLTHLGVWLNVRFRVSVSVDRFLLRA